MCVSKDGEMATPEPKKTEAGQGSHCRWPFLGILLSSGKLAVLDPVGLVGSGAQA